MTNSTGNLARVALLVLLGASLSACQTMGSAASGVGDAIDSVNPFSDSSPATADNSGLAYPDQTQGQTPDLASLPARPDSYSNNNQQVADSLAADRARAQYSGEALRGGTEPVAAAPAPGPATPYPSDFGSSDAGFDNGPMAAAPAPQAAPAYTPPPSQSSAAVPGALPEAAPYTPDSPVYPTASAPSYALPPPGSQPAVPAAGGRMAYNPSDASLGFQQSRAPALDASVSQFVPQPILARYRDTAADASSAGVGSPAISAVARPSGGPEMSGSVVANLDAVGGAGGGYYGPGGRPTAVVTFLGDGTALSAAGRAKVRQAAQIFRNNGSVGTVRVVGHASSRTGNMPVERHLAVIFEKSQSRANAVAQALIREGVPASKVLVEAVGDSQPIYYESMPQGEAGNRRAEIFVQG